MKKIISTLLCAAMLLAAFGGALAAKAEGPPKLLVLGDSIAVGMFALPSFPEPFDPYPPASSWDPNDYPDGYGPLVAREMGWQFANYAQSGDRTIDLLDKLRHNAEIRLAVGQADIIEISIGGNDILNASPAEMISLGLNALLGSYTTANTIFAASKANLLSIVAEIRTLNPGAVLIVQNMYDTGPNAINKMVGPLYTISESYWTGLIQLGNASVFSACLSANPGAFYLAEIYPAFNWKSGLMSPDFIHPNKAGHEVIAGVLLDLLRTIPFAVDVATDGHGTASASPANAAAGTEVTLTATPASGYHFKEWQVTGGGVMIAENKFTMPAQAVAVKAIFEKDAPQPAPVKYIFNTKYESTFGNWIAFIFLIGWIWMWF